MLVVGGGITGAGVALDAAITRLAHRSRRAGRLRVGDVVEVARSSSTAACATSSSASSRLVYENLAERQVALRNAPHLVRIAPVPHPAAHQGRAVQPQARPGARQRAVDVRPHRRAAHRQAAPADLEGSCARRTCRRCRADRLAGGVHLLRRPHRRRPPHARARAGPPPPTARWSPTTPASPALLQGRSAGRVRGARVEADGDELEVQARAVVNATGVWADDVRAPRRGRRTRDSIRPAKGIHITVPWAKVRNDIAAIVPVPKDKRSVFVVPWGDLTYVGTTDTDYDGPIDDPAVHARGRRLPARGAQRGDRRSRVTGGRRHGDVGGPAAAAAHGQQRAHRRPVAPPRGASLRERRRHRHRRQAHDVPADGRRHRRRGRRRSWANAAAAARSGCRSSAAKASSRPPETARAQRPRPSRRPLRHRGRRRSRSSSTADAELGEPLVPGLPYLRAEAVYAVRHEMARTLDDVLVAPHPRPAPGARRLRRAPPTTSPGSSVPSSAGATPSAPRQVEEYRAAVKAERAARRPARDRARRVARRVAAASDGRYRRADAADRVLE